MMAFERGILPVNPCASWREGAATRVVGLS